MVARGCRANSLGYVRRAAMGAAEGTTPSWAERLRGEPGSAGGGMATAAHNLGPPQPAATAAGDGTTASTHLGVGGEQQCGGAAPPGAADAARPAAGRTSEEGAGRPEEDDDEVGDLGDEDTRCKTPAELRREWDEAASTVKYLERRKPRVPQSVLDSARKARDEAEQAWRTAKPQHPLGKRLRWAAAELEAALEKENAHRAEVEEFEADVEQRRAALMRRQEADEARTARKREALDRLREEDEPSAIGAAVGRRAMEAIREVRPTMWATRMALEGIQTDVGPVLERVLEAVPEGSRAWLDIQGALSSVTGVHSILSDALRNTDEDNMHDMARGDSGDEGNELDSLDDVSLPAGYNEGGHDDAGYGGPHGDGDDDRPTTRRRLHNSNVGAARWTRAREGGEGSWKRLDWADEQEREAAARATAAAPPGQGRQGDGRGQQGAGAAGPASAGGAAGAATTTCQDQQRTAAAASQAADQRRKLEEAEARRAAEEAEERRRLVEALTPEERAQAEALHAQQAAAASAGFGTARALEIAQQVHSKRFDEVVRAARERDIPVDLAELRAMPAEELEDWARRHV